MSRRTLRSVFLALSAALLCAGTGFVSAAHTQSGRAHPTNAAGRATPVLQVDTTAGHAYVSMIETHRDQATDRSPQTLGAPTGAAGAGHLPSRFIAAVVTGPERDHSGGPALGSRAPPLHTA